MTQEKMIDFYSNEMDRENKQQDKRMIETWICKIALLIPSIVFGGIIAAGFVSSILVEMLFMFFTAGFSFVTIAFITQGERLDRQISSLKIAIYSKTLYMLKQENLSKQQLQSIDNIVKQTMEETNQIVSVDLDVTTHANQVRKVYRTYHDKIKRVFVSNLKNAAINVQETMETNGSEPKVSEQLTESQKENNISNVEPKISIQLKLTEILIQKGLTVEQTVRLLSTYSKNDYPTLIALLETDMISADNLQENFSKENPVSLIDDRMKREYTKLIENAQTLEGKQAMQKRYYQDSLEKYLESTTPKSELTLTKKK